MLLVNPRFDMPQKSKVFLVEDHPMFCERLAQVINSQSELTVIGEAGSAEDALKPILETEPDILLVDISLPGKSGLVFIKSLREQKIAIPVLVLSTHDDSTYAERAIFHGANGYISKNGSASDVLSAIRCILSGGIYLSKKATSDMVKKLHNPVAFGPGKLTERELEVVRLLGEGKSTREIAETLKLAVGTVDTYRARIKEKMNFRNSVELLRYATLYSADN